MKQNILRVLIKGSADGSNHLQWNITMATYINRLDYCCITFIYFGVAFLAIFPKILALNRAILLVYSPALITP